MIKIGVNIGICLRNNQHNFQLNRFTTSENIAKSFGGYFLTHTVYLHSLSDLQSTVLHYEQFVIDRYNVDLLLGGGQHLLATCQVGIHVNNMNRLSDGVVRDVEDHYTSHRQCQLCHVQSHQLHAPNTPLSISFNVRLFHSLTAAVTVPK